MITTILLIIIAAILSFLAGIWVAAWAVGQMIKDGDLTRKEKP